MKKFELKQNKSLNMYFNDVFHIINEGRRKFHSFTPVGSSYFWYIYLYSITLIRVKLLTIIKWYLASRYSEGLGIVRFSRRVW